MVNIRWLWFPLIGASVFLAVPGNETIGGMLGDVVGHFFSAALVAVVPVVGYRLLFKDIGEKEIAYIFGAAWTDVLALKADIDALGDWFATIRKGRNICAEVRYA